MDVFGKGSGKPITIISLGIMIIPSVIIIVEKGIIIN